MITDATPFRFGIRLRSVEAHDASFIVTQRNTPRARQFLSATSLDVQQQERWIQAQQAQQGDYYFIAETSEAQRVGAIGLYGICRQDNIAKAEWGRFFVHQDSRAAQAMMWHLFEIAFSRLGLMELNCDVFVDNIQARSLYTWVGLELIADDGACEAPDLKRRQARYRLRKNVWQVRRDIIADRAKKKELDHGLSAMMVAPAR